MPLILALAQELENELLVVGVSNVMSWCRSKNSDDKPLHESAYKTRKTSLQYKPIKLLETLVLSAVRCLVCVCVCEVECCTNSRVCFVWLCCVVVIDLT